MTCPAHVRESKDVTQFIETCRPLSSLAYSKEQKALAEPTAVALAKAIRPAGPASFVVNDSLPAAKQGNDASKVALCLCGRAKPTFGRPQDALPSCCSKCKTEGMLKLRGPRCRCSAAWPTFGMIGDVRPTCCNRCKEEGMIDIANRRCKCGIAIPSFGFAGDVRPVCCSKCKSDGMVDIKHRKCKCGTARPSFGFAGDGRPSRCKECKAKGMVNITTPLCKCGEAIPSFGFLGDAKPSCCRKCRAQSMVDIRNRRCRCGRSQPSLGFVDDKRPTACSRCKTDGMVHIVNSKCRLCKKQANYPDAAGRPRQLCAVHSAEVGAHTLSFPGRSRIASEFLDALEIHIGREFPFRHRFDAATGQWSGEEFTGLVSNRNLQPDAYDPEARIVVEFLGNFYHGFPPEHPQLLG